MLFILSPILSFWSSALYVYRMDTTNTTHSKVFSSVWKLVNFNRFIIPSNCERSMISKRCQVLSLKFLRTPSEMIKRTGDTFARAKLWRWQVTIGAAKKSRTLFSIECRSINCLKTWAIYNNLRLLSPPFHFYHIFSATFFIHFFFFPSLSVFFFVNRTHF